MKNSNLLLVAIFALTTSLTVDASLSKEAVEYSSYSRKFNERTDETTLSQALKRQHGGANYFTQRKFEQASKDAQRINNHQSIQPKQSAKTTPVVGSAAWAAMKKAAQL
ncbi:hypothetical protein KBC04_03455 [Candidatus Babeliales bacterium]|nr:hypothetical protein [Candidatus Babeliales bacterium]MBP9843891.1 hypothetical protein [Candidatus Babeliales bacterium]